MSTTAFPNADYFINNSPQMYKSKTATTKDRDFYSFNIVPVYISAWHESKLIFNNLLFGDADSLNRLKCVVQTRLQYKKSV